MYLLHLEIFHRCMASLNGPGYYPLTLKSDNSISRPIFSWSLGPWSFHIGEFFSICTYHICGTFCMVQLCKLKQYSWFSLILKYPSESIPFSCIVILRHTMGRRLLGIMVALVPESNKILIVRFFNLPLLVNIFTVIAKILVIYNNGVFWVIFCFLECLPLSIILNHSL